MKEIILFLISALPVFLLGLYIYKKDKNKEPAKILIKLFLAGMLSCVLVVLITIFLSFFFIRNNELHLSELRII